MGTSMIINDIKKKLAEVLGLGTSSNTVEQLQSNFANSIFEGDTKEDYVNSIMSANSIFAGSVSKNEIQNLAEDYFDSIDTNNDGKIQSTEVETKSSSSSSKSGKSATQADSVMSSDDLDGINLKSFKDLFAKDSKLVSSNKSLQNAISQDSNGSLYNSALEGYFSSVDTDGDGKLSKDELSSITGLDGDSSSVSDLELKFMLSSISTGLYEGLGNKARTENEEAAKVAAKEAASKAASSGGSSNSGAVGGSGSSGGSGKSSASSGSKNSSAASKPTTKEDIQKEIETKETEKGEVKTKSEEEIKDIETETDKQVKESMEKNKVDEKLKKEYEEQKQKLEQEITKQNSEINTQTGIIQDCKATISAKESAISSVTSQIDTLNGQLASIVDSGDPEKDQGNAAQRESISSKISNLESEKQKLEEEKQNAENDLTKAEKAKADAEKSKADAEKEKSNLLQTMADKNPNSGLKKVVEDTAKIRQESQTKISDLKAETESKVNELDSNIQELKTQLAQVEQKEKTDPIIAKNSEFDVNFDDMLGQVLGYEGGFSNNPNDKGGRTNFGITESTYRAFKGDNSANVENITPEEAKEIYYKNYYEASGAADIAQTNPKLAFAVFDASVNHGVGAAKKMLDASGGDVNTFMELRKQKYVNIVANNSTQGVFAEGWQNRWNNVYKYIDPSHVYENYIGA